MTAKQKKKLGMWGIVILAVAVIITGIVFAYTALSAGVFYREETKQDQSIIDQVWGGKAPDAATEKKIVNDVLNSQWPPPNPFLTAPVVPVPVVVPPSVRSDFKVEYKETASAKGKIDVKISPTNDPNVKAVRIENKTDQPLLMRSITEGRDASGKVIYSSGTDGDGWYKMDPRYIINDTETPGGKEGIVAKTFRIEVKE